MWGGIGTGLYPMAADLVAWRVAESHPAVTWPGLTLRLVGGVGELVGGEPPTHSLRVGTAVSAVSLLTLLTPGAWESSDSARLAGLSSFAEWRTSGALPE